MLFRIAGIYFVATLGFNFLERKTSIFSTISTLKLLLSNYNNNIIFMKWVNFDVFIGLPKKNTKDYCIETLRGQFSNNKVSQWQIKHLYRLQNDFYVHLVSKLLTSITFFFKKKKLLQVLATKYVTPLLKPFRRNWYFKREKTFFSFNSVKVPQKCRNEI